MQLINIRTVSVPSIGKLPLAANPGTFTPSGQKRDPKTGRLASDGGFIESEIQAKAELNINMKAGIDIQKLNAIKDEDVTIRLSDGSVHMMSQAFRSGEPVGFSEGEGKLVLMSNVSEKI